MRLLRTAPPPAIAASVASATRDELQKCGRVVAQAATTPAHALQFQAEYVRLRCEGVRAHAQLLQACGCLRTAPPPAIAASVASATRDELQKCGRVVAQESGSLVWLEQQPSSGASSLSEHRLLEAAHRGLLWLRDLRHQNTLTPQIIALLYDVDRIGSLGEERRDREIEGITARRLRLAAPPVTAASAALRLGTRRKPEHPVAIYDGDEARLV
ncbi:hypothetical protein HPB50_013265 [Hyalomma asiaticum]|uniref:Uncharacterized protein n=1 Tax=Hyalomma asiaticum TaxID=266040 RepID=A0ACB7TA19_HYAAI|nr:hypothetical protein HPB50_013265 [Hyalomma asiaticum]